MKFLLDENAEYAIAEFLKGLGHDVRIIGLDYPAGLSDEEVLRIANEELRILITNDRDFGQLIFRERMAHSGVIFFRLGEQPVTEKIGLLARILREHPHGLDAFVVVTRHRIRTR